MALLARDPEVPKHKKGGINHTRTATMLGLNQATLSRMLDGQSQHPTQDNARPLCRRYAISYDQLVGNDPIPGLFDETEYSEIAEQKAGYAQKSLNELIELLGQYSEEKKLTFISELADALPLADAAKATAVFAARVERDLLRG